MKILCITGWCRNGSTIIGNVLNEVPSFFHVGEIHFLWKNAAGQGANTFCGCGLHLTECELWSKVLAEGRPPGLSVEEHAAEVVARQRAYVRTRHTWRVLRHGLSIPGVQAHTDLMARTFRSVSELTGADVLVDTTKIPGEAALLPLMDGVEPYFVHLVRDPRAVAGSWSVDKEYCVAMPAHTSTAYWSGFNTASRALLRRHTERSMLLRYETFRADPERTISRLLRFVGADPADNPVHGREVRLHPNHTVSGNPDRFRSGTTLLREHDDQWKERLTVRARLATAALSWPQFHLYGYSHQDTWERRTSGSGT